MRKNDKKQKFEPETAEQRNERWAKMTKLAKSFAKTALTKEQRAKNEKERHPDKSYGY